jgi:Flp pilus assembly protein TadD
MAGSGSFAQTTAYEAANWEAINNRVFRDASGQVPAWVQRERSAYPQAGAQDPFDVTESRLRALGTRGQQPISGVVTVHQLEHKIPGKARKEFQKAVRENDQGHRGSAMDHLKKAINIDPEFAMARSDLGAYYLFEGKPDLAVEQLNKAIAIDPHSPMPYSNLAVAYMMQNKVQSAERAARQLAEVDHAGSTRSSLLLGMSLVMQNKFTDEAQQNLVRAERDFPQASLLLARVLAARGQIQPAKDRIQHYLASGQAEGASLAKKWMKKLSDATARADASKAKR